MSPSHFVANSVKIANFVDSLTSALGRSELAPVAGSALGGAGLGAAAGGLLGFALRGKEGVLPGLGIGGIGGGLGGGMLGAYSPLRPLKSLRSPIPAEALTPPPPSDWESMLRAGGKGATMAGSGMGAAALTQHLTRNMKASPVAKMLLAALAAVPATAAAGPVFDSGYNWASQPRQ